MKRKIKLIIGVLFILTSCSDVLDIAPDGKMTYDEIFSTKEGAASYLNSCYNNLPGKGVRYWFFSRGPVSLSDDSWDADAEAEPTLIAGRMYSGSVSPTYHPITDIQVEAGNGNYWNRYWNSIRLCGFFINRIDNVPAANQADLDEYARWKAEAHLLRAFYYTELLKWYGAKLPIIKNPFKYNDDFSSLDFGSYYEVVQFIIEDCDIAISSPQLPWRTTESYRVTKALAEAIKSTVILFAASPLNNDGKNYWEEAYRINKSALQSLRTNGYELYSKLNNPSTYQSANSFFGPENNVYSAIYNEYFTNTTNIFALNPADMETIYISRDGGGAVYHVDGVGAQVGYKSGTNPTQELVDAYETIDGQPILDLSKPYLDEKHLEPNYNKNNTLYNPDKPYDNRDPRFYASIYYNGSKRKGYWGFAEAPESTENYPAPVGNRTRVIATWVGEPQTGIHRTVRKATRTGYFHRKFLHPNSGSDIPTQGLNWKYYRLGEIILNFAESAMEAGYLIEAIDAVNEIRTRVGMPHLPINLSQEELRLRIRNERRIELAFEENRFFDIRRWSLPDGDLSATDKWITAMEITRNTNGSFTYNRRIVRDVERACYMNKYLWVPIPQSEADRLRSITGKNWQNPGW